MAERTPAERRRRIVRIALVALVVIVLIAVPAYVASRPQYFSGFASLKGKYGPWSKSTHVKADCQDCHVSPKAVPQTAYLVRMLGEFYYSLVARSHTPDVFETPTNAACLSCHERLRTVSPEGDLKIPHRAHVNILKMQCVECHDYLVHEKSPEGKHTPTMAGCLKCHDGDTAKNNCEACHTKKDTPASHKTPDWLVVHPEQATAKCDDCHARRPESHTADWRKTHGDRVAKHRNCEACHTAEFCIRCHGQVPPLNYDPDVKLVQ